MPAPSTPKGARQAESILKAALRCLGRDGYAETSLQQIAQEAGVAKRMVSYYYGSREELMAAVVRRLADRLVAEVDASVKDLKTPEDMVTAGIERLWSGLTGERALLVAYHGLIAESVAHPDLRSATTPIGDGLRELIYNRFSDLIALGYQPLVSKDALAVLIIATMQGLALDYLERGTTPELEHALSEFQHSLTLMLGTKPTPPTPPPLHATVGHPH